MERVYACIDLKSFYASCECHERNLNALTTNLVVADEERTEKTICLAVSPSLKSYGLKGRARLYEVISKVKEINSERKKNNHGKLVGKSYNNEKIRMNPSLELDFIIAKPRMSLYIKYSTKIYNIYLKYLSSDDIFVYSIDEVFCDITNYLKYNKADAQEFITKIILDIEKETGITATAGIGTNLYLAKVSMDIMAKHAKPNKDNVRVFSLDEMSYRKYLWNHRPLTDFWRVGAGYSEKLEANDIYTMGDICRVALNNEELLYDLFGVNAELLIDHAWGYEPCTISDIKNYKPKNNSLSRGQVLHEAYDYLKAKLIVMEMMDLLALDLVENNYVTNMLILTIGYDVENLKNDYKKDTKKDYYGRVIPKNAHGTINIDHFTSSSKTLTKKVTELYEKITNPKLSIRRISLTAANLLSDDSINEIQNYEQFDLFSDVESKIKQNKLDMEDEEKEKKMQKTLIDIKKKYGKNAIFRGMNLMDGATTIERNKEIGGHKA